MIANYFQCVKQAREIVMQANEDGVCADFGRLKDIGFFEKTATILHRCGNCKATCNHSWGHNGEQRHMQCRNCRQITDTHDISGDLYYEPDRLRLCGPITCEAVMVMEEEGDNLKCGCGKINCEFSGHFGHLP